MIDAEPRIHEERDGDRDEQSARDARRMALREEKADRAGRHGEIISVALLQAERARRIAAEMLEGERGENGGQRDREHNRTRGLYGPRAFRQHRFRNVRPSQNAYLAMKKPPTMATRKLVKTKVRRFSMNSRTGSPK